MAGLLTLVYSVAAIVVALAGLAFVLGFTGYGDDGVDLWSVLVTLVIGVFLVAMVGELLGFI